ncbi:MAG TPA: recombinase family protein [Ktedonobacterales bacterium]
MAGLPSGGRYGPLYGYSPGERRIIHGRQAGCLTWVIHEERARWVRWLFDTVLATDPTDLSLRQLANELDRRGAPKASGAGRWTSTHLRNILRNPTYCGRGRTGRYATEYVRARDMSTGYVRDVLQRRDRLQDTTAWEAETYPIPEDVVPPLVSPEVWDSVQEVLDTASALHNKGGPRRTDTLARSTLLNGGWIVCAECGRKMSRFWQTRDGIPYYRCHVDNTFPHHTHLTHSIAASKVDTLVLRVLAHALTDPEELLRIADASEDERRRAEADLELADAQDAATVRRLETLAAEQDNVVTALTALSQVPGMATEVTRLRARLTALETERQDLLTLRDDAYTRHVTARETILRSLFSTRDLIFHTDGSASEVGDAHTSIGPRMSTHQAAAFLGVPEGSDLGVPVKVGEPFTYELDDGSWQADVEADTVLTADVLFARLQSLSHKRLHRLFRVHNLSVRIKLPRPRVAGVPYTRTPMRDRVEIILHGRLIIYPATTGVDDNNVGIW